MAGDSVLENDRIAVSDGNFSILALSPPLQSSSHPPTLPLPRMSALMMTQQLRAPSKSALAAAPRRCAAAPRGAVRVRAASSIVDTAVAAGNFKTLVAALTAAGACGLGVGVGGVPSDQERVAPREPVPHAAGAARAPIARAWCHLYSP
jgi:hypothetical protein